MCSLCVFRVDPIPYDTPKPAGHTRFVCVSDTHSRTDGIQMPYGDVLLHTGDFTELGLPSEVKKFNDWLGIEQTHSLQVSGAFCPGLSGTNTLALPRLQ